MSNDEDSVSDCEACNISNFIGSVLQRYVNMWENMACTVATSFGSHIYNITKLIDKNEVTKDFINRL